MPKVVLFGDSIGGYIKYQIESSITFDFVGRIRLI